MIEEKGKESFITLDFSGTEKKFAHVFGLSKFIQAQQAAWSWLELVALEDGNLGLVWEPFKIYFKQAVQFTTSYNMHREGRERRGRREVQEDQTSSVDDFRKRTKVAVARGFILAEAPNARFILDLRDNKSPQIAGYALAFLNNTKIDTDNSAAREGALLATQYLQNSLKDSVRESTELRKQTRSLIKEIDEQRIKQTNNFESQKNAQASNFDNHIAAQTSDFEAQKAECASDFENLTNETKEKIIDFETKVKGRIVNFEAYFKEKTVLQSSSLYWAEKRTHHQIVTWVMATVTISIALYTAWYFDKKATEYFATTPSTTASTVMTIGSTALGTIAPAVKATILAAYSPKTLDAVASTKTITKPIATTPSITILLHKTTPSGTISNKTVLTRDDIWKFSIMLLISTIGVWLTRLSTKIFISNMHLGADAYERVTMIKTYLALLIDDRDLKSDDRQLILQTLFRPSSTGIIKDDGPITILESLAKILKRR